MKFGAVSDVTFLRLVLIFDASAASKKSKTVQEAQTTFLERAVQHFCVLSTLRRSHGENKISLSFPFN